MKKLIKSRKGAAMELAIGVMFLMMAFTIMLLSTSGLQNSLRVDDYEDFNEMVEVNNIGEHVLGKQDNTYKTGNYEIIEIDNNYSVKYSEAEMKYEIYKGNDFTDTSNLELVLTIKLNNSGEITSWN